MPISLANCIHILKRTACRALKLWILLPLFFFSVVNVATASIANRLNRVELRQKDGYTRISCNMDKYSEALISELPGDRLRLTINGANGPLFKKFRQYSDKNIGGLRFMQRGDQLIVTLNVAKNSGWRLLNHTGINNVTLDVGSALASTKLPQPPPGREKIRSGLGKLVRDFDPPLKTDIPFTPTDRQLLDKLLPEDDRKAFGAAESALYKGRFSEAEELLAPFVARNSEIKPLAMYRLGEVLYNLQKYSAALACFKEAEKLWPAYLNFNPSLTFYYGDSIVRSGDLSHGRVLLSSLISRLSDKKYAPTLLVRLGDIYSRHGREKEATALYENVAVNFDGNKAKQMAQLRLNDRHFMSASFLNYRSLSSSYKRISELIGDFDMREEASFKHTLLEALYGDSASALHDIISFQRKYPRGAFATVARSVRESLVAQAYKENVSVADAAAVIRFAEEHQEFLADAVNLPGFMNTLLSSFEKSALPIEKIKLVSFILERQWLNSGAPQLYEDVAESADIIGDASFAIKSFRTLLKKYPDYQRKNAVSEKLGALLFAEGKYLDAKNTLSRLQNKKERAEQPASLYFLGKSLWNLKEYKSALQILERYISSVNGGIYLADAYYVAVSARELTGDLKGAVKLVTTALAIPSNSANEPLLYKGGELKIRSGDKAAGKKYFEEIVKNGKDSDWKRLAQQAVASL